MSLARIAIDFQSELDEVLSVTVDKSKVTLPELVKERLEPTVLPIIKKAKDRYRSKSSGLTAGILPGRSPVPATPLRRRLTAAALAEVLEQVSAKHDKAEQLKDLKKLVREENYEVASELGW
jgi:hypothetical protein